MTKITEITKRNIFDELRSLESPELLWHGKLEEVDFLKRLYRLNELPTTDDRYSDMEGDIIQHRYNNYDWDFWWIIDDKRLNLFGNDEYFLKFLCETMHPVVRSDEKEIESVLKIFNQHLLHDGFELIPDKFISGKAIFKAIEIDKDDIIIEHEERFTREFALEQLKKCEYKIKNADYDGAITNSRSLMEDVLADIYFLIKKEELKKSGDLISDYKMIKNHLNLTPEKYSNDSVKQIVRSFVSIVDGVDSISNKMGDRHRRLVKPERHHAKLCVNSAKVIIDFLYDTMDHQVKQRELLLNEIIKLLDSERSKKVVHYRSYRNYLRSMNIDDLLNEEKVKDFIKKIDSYSIRLLIDELIDNFEINSFDSSNRFFNAMHILSGGINQEDINRIELKLKENDQSIGLAEFVEYFKDKTKAEK